MIYLENIILLLQSYLYFFIRGKADKTPKDVKRVLVLLNAKMGDMVVITPIFHAIKNKYPQTKVIVMGISMNKAVLAGSPDVDEYVIYKREIKYLKDTFLNLKVDAALLVAPDGLSLATLYLANVPLIVAPKILGTIAETATLTYRLILRLVRTVSYTMMTTYAPAEYLKILEPLGIKTDDTKKYLAFNEAAKIKIKNFFTENNISLGTDFIIGIAPSAGNKVKKWRPERYAFLIKYLREKYNAKIIIVGGTPDKEIVCEMFEYVSRTSDIIDTTSLFSVEELKALIAYLNLFISGDTGPIHIADAFDVPTVNILGPVGEFEMPPRGKYHRNVIPPRKKPVLFVMSIRTFDPIEAQKQIDDTTVEMVEEVVDTLISDIRK